MAREQVTTCDAPNCGADISKGDGRAYHLMVQGVTVPMREGSEVADTLVHPTLGNIELTHHDRHETVLQHHFCDWTCLHAWAEHQLDERHAAQEKHVDGLIANAQLLKDEADAASRPAGDAAAEA